MPSSSSDWNPAQNDLEEIAQPANGAATFATSQGRLAGRVGLVSSFRIRVPRSSTQNSTQQIACNITHVPNRCQTADPRTC
jgi:hypothetical protein